MEVSRFYLRMKLLKLQLTALKKNYNDYRHPDSVVYTDDVSQDVWRRDFTINALLLAVNGDIVDHVGGKKDLESKIIRAIGNPDERFFRRRLAYFTSVLF